MIKVKTNFNISAPNFNFQKDLKFVANNIIIPQLQKNIHNGVQVNGTPFPALEPETVKKKAGIVIKRTFDRKGNFKASAIKAVGSGGLKGFSVRTLIETGALVSSFIVSRVTKSSVTITLNAKRKRIGEYLQINGVGKKHKKFQFFGISKWMEKDALNYMKGRINAAVAAAKRGQSNKAA